MFYDQKCILIVGAGPVGLSLAIMLKQMDIPFRIVEKRVEKEEYSRAFGIQPRTLEIFKQMKVLDTIKSKGRVYYNGMDVYYDGELASRYQLNSIESSEPYSVGLFQSKIEEILTNRLVELGVEIEFGTEVTSLKSNGEEIEYVDVSKVNGKTERIPTEFLIGCDGGRSNVRKLSKIPFSGEESTLSMTLIDAVLETDISRESYKCSFICEDHSLILIWLDDTNVRLAIPYSSEKKPPTLEEATEIVKSNTFPHKLEFKRIDWFTNFKINERTSDQFFFGNVYLCGDAAHTHSPVGEHGMNTGIQDAYNLAWKLAYIYKGFGIPSVLNQTYHIERSAVAEMVVKTTGTSTRSVANSNVFNKLLFSYVIPFMMSFASFKTSASNSASEVNIKYKQNDLVRDTLTGLLYNTTIPGVGIRIPSFDLVDIYSNNQRNIHNIISGGYCFEIFLHIPEFCLDDSKFHHLKNMLMNSPSLQKLKIQSNDEYSLFNINTIISTKETKPNKWKNQISNTCETQMGEQFNQSRIYLDLNSQFSKYFKFASNQISLVIVRPDAVVGLSSPINLGDCQESIESYFSKFTR